MLVGWSVGWLVCRLNFLKGRKVTLLCSSKQWFLTTLIVQVTLDTGPIQDINCEHVRLIPASFIHRPAPPPMPTGSGTSGHEKKKPVMPSSNYGGGSKNKPNILLGYDYVVDSERRSDAQASWETIIARRQEERKKKTEVKVSEAGAKSPGAAAVSGPEAAAARKSPEAAVKVEKTRAAGKVGKRKPSITTEIRNTLNSILTEVTAKTMVVTPDAKLSPAAVLTAEEKMRQSLITLAMKKYSPEKRATKLAGPKSPRSASEEAKTKKKKNKSPKDGGSESRKSSTDSNEPDDLTQELLSICQESNIDTPEKGKKGQAKPANKSLINNRVKKEKSSGSNSESAIAKAKEVTSNSTVKDEPADTSPNENALDKIKDEPIKVEPAAGDEIIEPAKETGANIHDTTTIMVHDSADIPEPANEIFETVTYSKTAEESASELQDEVEEVVNSKQETPETSVSKEEPNDELEAEVGPKPVDKDAEDALNKMSKHVEAKEESSVTKSANEEEEVVSVEEAKMPQNEALKEVTEERDEKLLRTTDKEKDDFVLEVVSDEKQINAQDMQKEEIQKEVDKEDPKSCEEKQKSKLVMNPFYEEDEKESLTTEDTDIPGFNSPEENSVGSTKEEQVDVKDDASLSPAKSVEESDEKKEESDVMLRVKNEKAVAKTTRSLNAKVTKEDNKKKKVSKEMPKGHVDATTFFYRDSVLPEGWFVKVKVRGETSKVRSDRYFYTPDNRMLRSQREVGDFLAMESVGRYANLKLPFKLADLPTRDELSEEDRSYTNPLNREEIYKNDKKSTEKASMVNKIEECKVETKKEAVKKSKGYSKVTSLKAKGERKKADKDKVSEADSKSKAHSDKEELKTANADPKDGPKEDNEEAEEAESTKQVVHEEKNNKIEAKQEMSEPFFKVPTIENLRMLRSGKNFKNSKPAEASSTVDVKPPSTTGSNSAENQSQSATDSCIPGKIGETADARNDEDEESERKSAILMNAGPEEDYSKPDNTKQPERTNPEPETEIKYVAREKETQNTEEQEKRPPKRKIKSEQVLNSPKKLRSSKIRFRSTRNSNIRLLADAKIKPTKTDSSVAADKPAKKNNTEKTAKEKTEEKSRSTLESVQKDKNKTKTEEGENKVIAATTKSTNKDVTDNDTTNRYLKSIKNDFAESAKSPPAIKSGNPSEPKKPSAIDNPTAEAADDNLTPGELSTPSAAIKPKHNTQEAAALAVASTTVATPAATAAVATPSSRRKPTPGKMRGPASKRKYSLTSSDSSDEDDRSPPIKRPSRSGCAMVNLFSRRLADTACGHCDEAGQFFPESLEVDLTRRALAMQCTACQWTTVRRIELSNKVF